jgi:NAD(P)-dependent dehydrogenase (short-subunit alcohol dehydrogenase family)
LTLRLGRVVRATTLEGEVALVTGADKEVARAVVLNLGLRGANVVAASESDDPLTSVQRRISMAGGDGSVRSIDTGEMAGLSGVVTSVIDSFGRLDHVVNHAGIDADMQKLAESDPERFRQSLDLTLHGIAACMHEAIPHVLADGGGTVVNVVGTQGKQVGARRSPTVAAKYGVMGLTKTAAIEYAEDDVLITALCPGFVETPLLDETGLEDPESRARVQALDPVDRFTDTEEVAAGIAWLCSGDPPFLPAGSAIPEPESGAR